jgi:hypothetical protein
MRRYVPGLHLRANDSEQRLEAGLNQSAHASSIIGGGVGAGVGRSK